MLNAEQVIQVQTLLSSIEDLPDVREPPDNKRRGQFRGGWADATTRGQTFGEAALQKVTWNNLGYRCGKVFGSASDDEIVAFYTYLADHYESVVNDDDDEEMCILMPDEDEATDEELEEGRAVVVTVNAFERNSHARAACIAHHGAACLACGFDFGEFFPDVEAADGFIHVHHLRPLSECGGAYIVDPIKDLVPLCPNCHALAHMRSPPFAVEELQAMYEDADDEE